MAALERKDGSKTVAMVDSGSARGSAAKRKGKVATGSTVALKTKAYGALKGPGKALAFQGNIAEIIEKMRSGIPASVVPVIADRYGLSQDGFFGMLGLPKSTMKARLAKDAALSSSEQDRIYRAEKVWERAMGVLEDENAVREWVVRANRSLGGAAPLTLLDTEPGYELVLDTLARIEYGIVS